MPAAINLLATAVLFSGLFSASLDGVLVPLLGLLSLAPSRPKGGYVRYADLVEVCGNIDGEEGVGGGGAGLLSALRTEVSSVSVSEETAMSSQEAAGLLLDILMGLLGLEVDPDF